ncbi:hypothetical protein BDV24DRAFT_155397 [Aspergillus arachidicola]|uniref:F-box domain-containing protein n=1 Tax=Aspergillus arachidicola TaxID=656916 RepID=A0A5N6XSN7_9EURO|nr:hypothetical protein BDV24DRAFT_155397 [Aspergillus arachidicola]
MFSLTSLPSSGARYVVPASTSHVSGPSMSPFQRRGPMKIHDILFVPLTTMMMTTRTMATVPLQRQAVSGLFATRCILNISLVRDVVVHWDIPGLTSLWRRCEAARLGRVWSTTIAETKRSRRTTWNVRLTAIIFFRGSWTCRPQDISMIGLNRRTPLMIYPLQYREEPDPAVQKAADENWVHVSGDEWLAANPFYVPKLREILGRAMDTGPSFIPQDGAFEPLISLAKNTSDPFAQLPQEILDMIIDNLSTKDIISLRLVSRKFYQLHVSLWHRLIQEDMPWLWEVWSNEKPYFWATVTQGDIKQNKGETRIEFGEEKIMTHTINVDEHLAKWTMPIPTPGRTNWFLLYRDVKRHWNELRGLWNRRRIWNYQEGLIASLRMHILSSDDHTV